MAKRKTIGILPRANDLWKIKSPGEYFSESHKSIDPMTFSNRKNGWLICIANGDHLLKGMEKDCGTPKVKISDTFLYSGQDAMDTSLSHCSDTSARIQLYMSGPCDNFSANSS